MLETLETVSNGNILKLKALAAPKDQPVSIDFAKTGKINNRLFLEESVWAISLVGLFKPNETRHISMVLKKNLLPIALQYNFTTVKSLLNISIKNVYRLFLINLSLHFCNNFLTLQTDTDP